MCQVDVIMSEPLGSESTATPHSWHPNCVVHPECQIDVETSPPCTMVHKNRAVCLSSFHFGFCLSLPLIDSTLWSSGDRVLLFPPTSILLLLIPFSFFTSSSSSFLSSTPCPLPNSPVSSSLYLSFCCLASRGGEKLKVVLFLCPVLVHFFFFSISDCGYHQRQWHFGKISPRLCIWFVCALWPLQSLSSSGHFSCSFKYIFGGCLCENNVFLFVIMGKCNVYSSEMSRVKEYNIAPVAVIRK